MDKDTGSKSIKLNSKERRILRNIDKSSKWEDISSIQEINKEIINLEIYKDFIGLGCSRYLNESAEKGSLDIEEMFRNCREAEKIRQRVKKKERKETGGKSVGKAGLTRGNVGSSVRQDIKPKEVETKQIKENPIVSKARQIGKDIVDGLTKSERGDDWKAVIAKTGLKFGLEGLFGIVLGVVEYSVENPVGGIAITSAMIGVMSKIYQYVYETETGKKVVGNVVDWFKGKLNELIDYITGKGINIISKKGQKKKKKKPFDRGSGAGKGPDTDDDDDDSGDSGDYSVDFDELNEYEDKTEKKDEPKEEPKREQQDLRGQQAPQQEVGITGQILATLGSQLAQAQTQLVNTNTARLFEQNNSQRNPLPRSEGTTTTTRTNQPPNPTQDKEDPKPQEPLSDPLGSMGRSVVAGLGALGTALGGHHIIRGYREQLDLNNIIPFGPQRDPFGTFNTPAQFRTDTQPLVQPQQPPQTGSLNEPVVQPDPASNNLNNQGQMTDERREQEELLRKQQEDKQKQEEQQRKVNQAIDDMDIRGRAWGAVLGGMSGGGGSKTAQANSIIPVYYREPQATQTEMLGQQTATQTETVGGLLSQAEAQEEQSLIGDVERSANEMYKNAQMVAQENQRLEDELGLIRAQAGEEAERKMSAREQEIMEEQKLIEEKARTNRIFNLDRGIQIGQTTMEAISLQNDNSPPAQSFLTSPEEGLRMIDEDVDAPLTREQKMARLQTNSLVNVMTNNRYIGQRLVDSVLAGQMILGQARGRRPQGGREIPDAREYLIRTMGIDGSDIQSAHLSAFVSGFIPNFNPNSQFVSDLQQLVSEIEQRVDNERKTRKKANYNLLKEEIQAVANLLYSAETGTGNSPPRQEEGMMAVAGKVKKDKK